MKKRDSFPKPNRQGLLVGRTLSSQFFRLALLAAIAGIFAALAPVESYAQDDLSVPGLTDPAEDNKPDVKVSADGLVTDGGTSVFGLIAKGGWAMWVLGAFSFAVVGLAIFCGIDLRKDNFCSNDLQATLHEAWSAGNLDAVNEAVHNDPTTLARMTASVAGHIGETGYSPDDNELLRGMMAEAGQKANRTRARVINYFSVIAQASPMMGLLGTVSGMIKAFGSLSSTGMAKPDELAGHISEALITTATGLIIALPAIFLYYFFRDRIEELIMECEDFGVDILTILRRSAIAAVEEMPADDYLAEDTEGDGGTAEEEPASPESESKPEGEA